jgi:hypothetical protein
MECSQDATVIQKEVNNMRKSIILAMLLCIAIISLATPAQAYTTEVRMVKYAADGETVLDETTVNYTWMEANLPVQGDGTTHYYYQGPIFEEEWENTYGLEYTGDWGSSEEKWDRVDGGSGYVQEEQCNCYPNKDLGACKGTDVKDLCNLVGGMSPGDEVKIKASDGFYKMFPYSVIYNSEPALGPYVVTWYSMDAGGATSGYTGENYTNGMRAMFFSDTSTNPWSEHITGIGDMTNYIPEDYWHYYVNWPIFYPALGGYTVKHVSNIEIYSSDFVITGYIFDSENQPVNESDVGVTNTNTGESWNAETYQDSNYYLVVLGNGGISSGDILRIEACKNISTYESNCNISEHEVTQAEIDDGGIINLNRTLNHYCQNYLTYPYCTWEQSNWSGPAVMQMMVDHYRPEEPSQSDLNEIGIAHNQGCNSDLLQVDPAGMEWTLNEILHNTASYGGGNYANYGIGSSTDINDTLHYMCKWHYLGPGAAPAYGDYSNWMVVRGIHTDVKPTFTQGSYEIYGFWMNDPYNETLDGPGGIGENTYKSVEQWKSLYHKVLNVNSDDTYNGTYVAVCEPPEDDEVEVTLARPKPRFADAITPELMAKPMMVYGTRQLALEKVVRDDKMLKIVAAAIDSVNEELVPYDSEFAEAFAKTVPGKPMLISSDNGDYYVVPFNVPMKVKPVKKMPVVIEKASGLKKFERVKRVDEKIGLKPITVPQIKAEKTLVVVIVDAEDGSFKEASWVENPVKYLPVSKIEAVKLVLGEMDITSARELRRELRSKPTIELVYRDASPYYPDWKVTVGDKVFYISQEGSVS